MSERSAITAEDKIAVIKREIALRMLVYPHRVSEGKMKPDKADYEIKVMQEILADYRGLNRPTETRRLWQANMNEIETLRAEIRKLKGEA